MENKEKQKAIIDIFQKQKRKMTDEEIERCDKLFEILEEEIPESIEEVRKEIYSKIERIKKM